MAETMILAGVTRDKLDEARRQILEASGLSLEGDVGTVEGGGYKASYRFDEASGRLTLVLERKPRLVPAWVIRRGILARVKDFGIYEVKV